MTRAASAAGPAEVPALVTARLPRRLHFSSVSGEQKKTIRDFLFFSLKANSKKKLGFVSYGGMARFPGRSSVCSLNCRAEFFPRGGGVDSRGGGSFFLRGFFLFGFARGTARVLGTGIAGAGRFAFELAACRSWVGFLCRCVPFVQQ